jgi:hypothetical protein
MNMTAPVDVTRFGPLSLHNVSIPDHLTVRTTKGNLLTEFHQFGYDGEQFFGTAFIQGKRLQFTTAMPISTMIKVSKIDRAKAGAGVDDVMKAANRPKVAGHARALRDYFIKTACADEKFILPAFAFNFGDESTTPEDAPDAVLLIYANEGDNSTNGWPALFQLPHAIKLDTTDGAHRGGEIDSILNDKSLSEDQKAHLRRNACDVKIIFERKRIDAHQDFADCAKAKPITGSLISTFDVRDLCNSRAAQLVQKVPFLQHYVDATASNVNLSAGSLKIWSMSAVRGFVRHVQEYSKLNSTSESEVERTLDEKMQGAEHFLAALVKHMPQLRALDLARKEPKVHTETPATFRARRGGDVMLRGVGLSIVARGFDYAKHHNLVFDDVAAQLGKIDWHLLDCEREQLPDTSTEEGRRTFADEVRKHVMPTWSGMVVIGESRFRIGSSSAEADSAWSRILAKFEPALQAEAAE